MSDIRKWLRDCDYTLVPTSKAHPQTKLKNSLILSRLKSGLFTLADNFDNELLALERREDGDRAECNLAALGVTVTKEQTAQADLADDDAIRVSSASATCELSVTSKESSHEARVKAARQALEQYKID